LRATIDYISGTLSGAVFGLLVALVVSHATEAGLLAVLALSVAPMAALAAFKSNFAIAPATACIVILLPTMTQATSIQSAVDRVAEAVVGAAVGLAVSFLGPKRAPGDETGGLSRSAR
jgi:uncharacterized membrane protein YccC